MLVLTKQVISIDAIIDHLRRGGETVGIQREVVFAILDREVCWMCPSCGEARHQIVIPNLTANVEICKISPSQVKNAFAVIPAGDQPHTR